MHWKDVIIHCQYVGTSKVKSDVMTLYFCNQFGSVKLHTVHALFWIECFCHKKSLRNFSSSTQRLPSIGMKIYNLRPWIAFECSQNFHAFSVLHIAIKTRIFKLHIVEKRHICSLIWFLYLPAIVKRLLKSFGGS